MAEPVTSIATLVAVAAWMARDLLSGERKKIAALQAETREQASLIAALRLDFTKADGDSRVVHERFDARLKATEQDLARSATQEQLDARSDVQDAYLRQVIVHQQELASSIRTKVSRSTFAAAVHGDPRVEPPSDPPPSRPELPPVRPRLPSRSGR
jgi:hypothetical protein